jgi:hypothetical protein
MDLRKLRCYVAYMVSFEKRFSSFHANTKCRRVKNDFVSETFVEISGFSGLLKQLNLGTLVATNRAAIVATIGARLERVLLFRRLSTCGSEL